MTPRRLVLGLVVLLLLGSGGFAAASVLAKRAPQRPAPVESVHKYYRAGPSARYEYDNGGIGVVRPLRFKVTQHRTQVGVVELSFRYRTKGDGPFTLSVGVAPTGERHGVLVRPHEVELPPAPGGSPSVVRFLVPALEPGVAYAARPMVNSVFSDSGTNEIVLHQALLTIDLD